MRIITVSNLSKVSISCPSVIAKASEFKYLLFFNDSIISRIQLVSLCVCVVIYLCIYDMLRRSATCGFQMLVQWHFYIYFCII